MKKDLIIYTDNIDPEAINQIYELIRLAPFDNAKVRIMPDVHYGKGCVVGFTSTTNDKLIPNVIGVDIGCGMLTTALGKQELDLPAIDAHIRQNIPAGAKVHKSYTEDKMIRKLRCFKHLENLDKLYRSMGTLGGGNHFIELDRCENGTLVLMIHSGSRSLGSGVAEYYEHEAFREMCKKERKKAKCAYYEERGEGGFQRTSRKGKSPVKIVRENAVLSGKLFEEYLHDIAIVQGFAEANRRIMAETICREMGFTIADRFSCVHNYVDTEHMILRKGAISARMGERVIVPLNMRDGAVIGTGKGNPEWNFSAPHGAGRACARHEAKKAFTVEEYREQMAGIYTTTVQEGSLDECPMAYKPPERILPFLAETVEIEEIAKPIYNFKACE